MCGVVWCAVVVQRESKPSGPSWENISSISSAGPRVCETLLPPSSSPLLGWNVRSRFRPNKKLLIHVNLWIMGNEWFCCAAAVRCSEVEKKEAKWRVQTSLNLFSYFNFLSHFSFIFVASLVLPLGKHDPRMKWSFNLIFLSDVY